MKKFFALMFILNSGVNACDSSFERYVYQATNLSMGLEAYKIVSGASKELGFDSSRLKQLVTYGIGIGSVGTAMAVQSNTAAWALAAAAVATSEIEGCIRNKEKKEEKYQNTQRLAGLACGTLGMAAASFVVKEPNFYKITAGTTAGILVGRYFVRFAMQDESSPTEDVE